MEEGRAEESKVTVLLAPSLQGILKDEVLHPSPGATTNDQFPSNKR